MPTLLEIHVADFLYLAESVARRFHDGKENIRDSEVYAVAYETLVCCVSGYNPEMGPFENFAAQSMRNRVVQYLRRFKRRKRIANFVPLEDIAERKEEIPHQDTKIIQTVLGEEGEDTQQDGEDKQLLREVYLLGVPVAALAQKLGVSRVTVYGRLKRIIGKIRERHREILEKETWA